MYVALLFLFFTPTPHSLFIICSPFLRNNRDPGSHSRLFSPPPHYCSCLAFLSRQDFSCFFAMICVSVYLTLLINVFVLQLYYFSITILRVTRVFNYSGVINIVPGTWYQSWYHVWYVLYAVIYTSNTAAAGAAGAAVPVLYPGE